MKTVTVVAGQTIELGYQYDNYATEVVFPSDIVTPFITNFGSSGIFAIWYRRSGDSLGYPIGDPLVTFDSSANTITWQVVEADTANPGTAQVQLRYIIDEVCVMSQMFTGVVSDSVDVGTTVPEPMEQWADAFAKAGSGGQPKVAETAADMTDTSIIYLYVGSETGYVSGDIYYYDGSEWKDLGAYGGGHSSPTGEDTVPPILYLTGDISAMTKNPVTLKYNYVDSSEKEQRTGWLECKWQGQSSLTYPKKNFNLKFFHDALVARKDKIEFIDGCKQSKWTAKANYIDSSHARNIISARLWTQMVKSRHTEAPKLLKDSPRYGAIDGYPMLIYINDEFQGLYTMNIKKDDFTFGVDEANPLHCVVCGDANNDGDNTKALATEFRSASTTGWVVEVPDAFPVIDNGDGTTTNVSDRFVDTIRFVMNSTDADFKATLNDHIDVESAIDYFIYTYFIGAFDNLGRNLILATYDGGVKWYCSAYDVDATWGSNAFGQLTFPATGRFPQDYAETNSLLWERLQANFADEIYARYLEARATCLKNSYIAREFTTFMNSIPTEAFSDDLAKWPNMPNKRDSAANLAFILNFLEERSAYVDRQMARMATPTAIESVTVTPAALAFTRSSVRSVNDQYFSAVIADGSDFMSKYYLDNTTHKPVEGTNVNDMCTPIMGGYDFGAVVLNPDGKGVKGCNVYDSEETYLDNAGRSQTAAHIFFAVDRRQRIRDANATKFALQISTMIPDNIYVALPRWTTLESSLVPSGTGDLYTGPIIPVPVGAIVLTRMVPSNTETSYNNAVCTYATASDEASSYISRLNYGLTAKQIATISDATATYIGFCINHQLYANGGHLDYCIIPSEADFFSSSYSEYTAPQTVRATYTPENATVESVEWNSGDSSVATVSGSGLSAVVTAVADGTTTVNCVITDTDGFSETGTATVTVSSQS